MDFQKNLNDFQLPEYILNRWMEEFKASKADALLAQQGLKEWFLLIRLGAPRTFGMTSKSIDFLWHEMILNTRLYQDFCEKCVGFFVHHTTNEATSGDHEKTQREEVLRSWMGACAIIGQDSKNPKVLPLLFGLDASLGVENGHFFRLEQDAAIEKVGFIVPSRWLNLT